MTHVRLLKEDVIHVCLLKEDVIHVRLLKEGVAHVHLLKEGMAHVHLLKEGVAHVRLLKESHQIDVDEKEDVTRNHREEGPENEGMTRLVIDVIHLIVEGVTIAEPLLLQQIIIDQH